ncbi:hypothetical protein [Glaciihabitans sp. UYNi722]|uniref:hypothetical protein n=1 Tax=Glaciihabitans sp. UYNi722 TaxID=3156344 RepID=UPI00339849C6
MDSNSIRLVVEVTREGDGSFALSIEDDYFGDSDKRYVGGLSEGQIFDPAQAAEDAGWLVKRYLAEGEQEGEMGAIYRIAAPLVSEESAVKS